jgi:metallo-beta-lactamase family protein
MKIRFAGAAETVTGSRNIITYGNKHVLVDAGLFQGPRDSRNLNWYPNINAKTLSAIILTHAHIDHTGLIPKLFKEGFRGRIFCTKATKDLCEIMLLDSAHLQEEDAHYANKSGYSHHSPALPLYGLEDAKGSLELFVSVERETTQTILPGLTVRFTRSGHILGSSFVELSFMIGHDYETITFSGDLGNGRSKIIKPPCYLQETDYLVLESTYGDRLQSRIDPKISLAEIISQTANQKGVLVIPAFTVGRTQDLLHLIKLLEEEKSIPTLPVFVDSPMANAANKIFLNHPEEHLLMMENGILVAPISPSQFNAVTSMEDSKALMKKEGPMIIITASGMLTGGRIMHHLKERLPDSKNIILFVGFQAMNTKGRLLQEGLKTLRIHHEEIPVNAEIKTIDGLSAHADYQDTLDWLSHLKRRPKMIFINHGEKIAALALKKKIEERFNFPCYVPRYMEEIEIGLN